jgi:hypothetical protein
MIFVIGMFISTALALRWGWTFLDWQWWLTVIPMSVIAGVAIFVVHKEQ